MTARAKASAGGAILALLVLFHGARGLAAESLRIVAIDVFGAARVSADAVRQVMSTKVGGEFDPARVREDVKAIYRMGYFTDVRFDAEEAADGVRLTVVLKEKPLVATVQFEGHKDVDFADIRAAITVKERTLFQEEKVKESSQKILEVYQNKGFYDAAVAPAVTEEPDGTIRVNFRIAEGKKVKIAKIQIAGNVYLTRKEILKPMETSPEGFFSFITDSGTFKKDVLETDVRRIEALYQNKGFLESKVFDPEIARGRKGLTVTIRIIEGRQFRIGKVGFAGETEVPESELRKAVKLSPGELFNRETVVSDLLTLTTILNDRGYAQAIVSPGVDKRSRYPVADVTYRIERGRKFVFGRVEIEGNTKTFDRVVRRNLEVSDGRIYSATGLKESKENLTRTSYFKDVKISTAPSAAHPGEMDVKIGVQEAPTGTLSGGAGYSSVDKVFGVVSVTENNLFGYGWRSSLSSQFGARRTVYSLDFRNPHFLDTDYSLLLNLYNTNTRYPDFRKKAIGGKIGVGYTLDRFTTTSLSYRLDRTRISEIGLTISEILKKEFAKGAQTTSSLAWAWNRNTTDKFIDPSRGATQSVSVEYAGGPLGGDSQFVKYFLNGKKYVPAFGTSTLSGNLSWGHVVSTNHDTVPIFERFFLGGPYNIRGFKSRSLSPTDINTKEAIGGNKELVGNLEYVFPLFNEIGFKGAVFFDAGNSWRQGDWPWKGGSPAIRMGAGLGVRWYSPMGPLRFEWGWNLNRQPGESKRVAEFTIGTAF